MTSKKVIDIIADTHKLAPVNTYFNTKNNNETKTSNANANANNKVNDDDKKMKEGLIDLAFALQDESSEIPVIN